MNDHSDRILEGDLRVYGGLIAAALFCILAMAPAEAGEDQVFLEPNFPADPCVLDTLPFDGDSNMEQLTIGSISVGPLSTTAQVFYVPEWSATTKYSKSPKPVVLIVDGNGYKAIHYYSLARFLARNDFIAAIAERPQNWVEEEFVVEVLTAVFAELDLAEDTPVGVIGHSKGGAAVVQGAIHNQETTGFDIRAVVGLAPSLSGIVLGTLTGDHASSYLLIYGSQDEDVTGVNNSAPSEAFAAYDLAGTEESTTCSAPPCAEENALERTMVYVHGASHHGLIDLENCPWPCTTSGDEYLATADQFCITKGYVNAFLRWKLLNQTEYKNMLRGRYLPPSMAGIETAAPDFKGNGLGTPLRLSFQVSPPKRRTLQNFEDWNDGDVWKKTAAVGYLVLEPGEEAGSPGFIRHLTSLAIVWWPEHQSEYQFIGFKVPDAERDASNFSHFAIRLGQVHSAANPNPINGNQNIQVCLRDGHKTSCEWSDDWGSIPPTDPRSNDTAHSAMSTIAIRLGAFKGIDRSNVEAVVVAFPPRTEGTLLVDSMEWWLD